MLRLSSDCINEEYGHNEKGGPCGPPFSTPTSLAEVLDKKPLVVEILRSCGIQGGREADAALQRLDDFTCSNVQRVPQHGKVCRGEVSVRRQLNVRAECCLYE